jgi:hypothetical protein
MTTTPAMTEVAAQAGVAAPPDPAPRMAPTKLMMCATVRIVCVNQHGVTSTGTGFFFHLFKGDDQAVPVLVTNKHVVRGAVRGILNLTLEKTGGGPDENAAIEVNLDSASPWLNHPDPNVDLIAHPCAPFLANASNNGKRFIMSP